jgi:hypothetical protein
MDFATILDYGYKQQKKSVEGTQVFVPMKGKIQEEIKKKVASIK